MNNISMDDLASYIKINDILEKEALDNFHNFCNKYKRYGGDESEFDRLEEKVLLYKLRKKYALELLNENQYYKEINSIIDDYIVKKRKK